MWMDGWMEWDTWIRGMIWDEWMDELKEGWMGGMNKNGMG